MTNEQEVHRIELMMHPGSGSEAGNLTAPFLQAFEDSPAFVPESWGRDERKRLPFRHDEALANHLSPDSKLKVIFLHRDSQIRFTGYADFGKFRFVTFEFHKSIAVRYRHELLALVDRLAAVVQSKFGVFHLFRKTAVPWVTDEDRILRWMSFCAQPIPVRFRANGPLGLGTRTYFGGEILSLIDHSLLLATPASVTELPWGGIRIDLADDLWDLDQSTLLQRWQRAMEHLAPSGIFAEPVFDKDNRTVDFKPSRLWRERNAP